MARSALVVPAVRRPHGRYPPLVATLPPAKPKAAPSRWRVRLEDWLLAGWVALVAPALIRLQAPSGGVFDGGRPLDGILGLIGILGVAVCLVTGSEGDTHGALAASAVIGPFTGGLLLVAFSTVAALGLAEPGTAAVAVVVAAVAVAVRLRYPVLPVPLRRALVTPYVLVTGTLFWGVIGAVMDGGSTVAALRDALPGDPSALPAAGFLLAFSAVYYAMLVFAPRQVAEREGGPPAWIGRYLLFVGSVAFGTGWLLLLAG